MAGDDRLLSPIQFRAAVVVAAALFMEMLDATIVLTALPALGASFGVRASEMSLSVTAYAVALAALIPASGWVADRFGGKRVFLAAVAVFTLASLGCATASSLPVFIGFRVLQGTAGAMMSPVGRLVVMASVERRQLIRAIAVITWPALVAPILGPLVGGWLVDTTGWRAIFLINLPIGLAGLLAAALWLPDDCHAVRKRPLDGLGLILCAGALATLVGGLDAAGHSQTGSGLALGLIAAALVLCVAAVLRLKRAQHPLLELTPLSLPTFTVSAATWGLIARLAISATPFLIPLLFQQGFGFSATAAGSLLMIYMAGNLAMKPMTTGILERWSFRDVLAWNGAVGAAAVAGLAFADRLPLLAIGALLFVAGLSRSMNFTATNTLAFADVEGSGRGAATALSGTLQQIAFSVGIAGAALALNLSLQARGGAVLGMVDFRWAFLAVAGLLAVSAAGYRFGLHTAAGAALNRPATAAADAGSAGTPSGPSPT